MDGRKALPPGTVLHLHTATGSVSYTIHGELGRGGSCLVYDASYTDNLGNRKLVRIKECCPHGLKLQREADGTLTARDAGGEKRFQAEKMRLQEAYQRNHELFCLRELTNTVSNTTEFYEANGTVYIVSTYLNGETFSDHVCASLHECLSLMAACARILLRIHEAGYLYLDLKPDNILTIHGSSDLVQIFDFDSLISFSDINRALQDGDSSGLHMSYSRGYAALEQQTGKLREIGPCSDVYSLGAVLYYALWGRTPDAFAGDPSAVYDFAAMKFSDRVYRDRLFRELTAFFHRTLASYTRDRFQTMQETLNALETLCSLSDERLPCLISSPVSTPVCFMGREADMQALDDMLRHSGTVSLWGTGGMGKSTLARAWIGANRDRYDAVLYLYSRISAQDLICDDMLIQLNTVERFPDENQEAYCARKTRALKELCSRQHVLLVLDDLNPEHLQGLKPILEIGWQVLLISRLPLPEGFCPSLHLKEMQEKALENLFAWYARREICGEEDRSAIAGMVRSIAGHTLTLELLARHVARNYLTIHEAYDLVASSGLKQVLPSQVDYIRDQQAMQATFSQILDRLMESERFSVSQRLLMKLLAVFHAPGIRIELVRKLTDIPVTDLIRDLENSGWLSVTDRRVLLHPLLRDYIQAWGNLEGSEEMLNQAMENLYGLLVPEDIAEDADKRFTRHYRSWLELMDPAAQLIEAAVPSPARQRLLFRILMDGPVDQDENILLRMLDLIRDPVFLTSRQVLRLYTISAYLLGRLHAYEDAFELLEDMKQYLKDHPSHYYQSQYHRAFAVLLNNRYGSPAADDCLHQEDLAIRSARRSSHPDAKLQLASSLMERVTSLLIGERNLKECPALLMEAGEIIDASCGPYDYERYQFLCVSAMYFAQTGSREEAEKQIACASDLARASTDSPMAWIDHLLDQASAIHAALLNWDQAIAEAEEAIRLCTENEAEETYRAKRFDALMYLAHLHTLQGDFRSAADTYDRAEQYREDSPFLLPDGPLCPEDIRRRAEGAEN